MHIFLWYPLLRVMLKRKAVKFSLKAWAAIEFGNVKMEVQKASKNLLRIHNGIVVHGFSESLFLRSLMLIKFWIKRFNVRN